MRSVFSPLLIAALSTAVCLTQAAPSGSASAVSNVCVWTCPNVTAQGNYTLSGSSSNATTLTCSYEDVIDCYYNETSGFIEYGSPYECAVEAICSFGTYISKREPVVRAVEIPSTCINYTCPLTADGGAYNLTQEAYKIGELLCGYTSITNTSVLGCGYNLTTGDFAVGNASCPAAADPCSANLSVRKARSLEVLARTVVDPPPNCTEWACPAGLLYGGYYLSFNSSGPTIDTCGYTSLNDSSSTVSCFYDTYTKNVTSDSPYGCYPTEVCIF